MGRTSSGCTNSHPLYCTLRAERRAKEEERKERKENAKERRVDQLDARTEWWIELDAAEKQTRSMAKPHLNAAERMYDAALKCKTFTNADGFGKERAEARTARHGKPSGGGAKGAREAHGARRTGDERDEAALRTSRKANVHFPRHASTIAEIKNKAEEERANLRSTVRAVKLERAKRVQLSSERRRKRKTIITRRHKRCERCERRDQ